MTVFMKRLIFLALLFSSVGSHASRDRGFFLGGGFSLVDVGVVDFYDNSVEFKSGELVGGYKYNAYLGFDVRYGLSMTDEIVSIGTDPNTGREVGVDASLDSFISYYYRPEIANDIARLYLLIGQSSVTVSRENQELGISGEASESGFSYGVGFSLWLNKRFDVTLEYRQLLKTEFDSFASSGVGLLYRF